jgi:hypothetical protein
VLGKRRVDNVTGTCHGDVHIESCSYAAKKTLEVLVPLRYAMWAKNRRNYDGKPI